MGVRINGMRKLNATYKLMKLLLPLVERRSPEHHFVVNSCDVHRRAFVTTIRMMIVCEVLNSRVWSDPR